MKDGVLAMPIMITCPGCKSKLRIRDEYAGKAMKCPRCSASVSIPSEDVAEVAPEIEEVEPLVEETAIADVQPRPRASEHAATIKCPECGKRVSETTRRCRYCQALLDADDDWADSPYLPCPKCGASGSTKVEWTWWGRYLGPKLFNHVVCPECEHGYNGMTGGSNIAAKILFVLVPLLGIAGILVALFFVLKNKGVL
jgi:DNA-directed RNA polymerase subunit M/transcription elongation factor TFIIS